MSEKDLKILGLTGGATPEEIKEAYRSKARILHPDVNNSKYAEDEFKELNCAFNRLSGKTDDELNIEATAMNRFVSMFRMCMEKVEISGVYNTSILSLLKKQIHHDMQKFDELRGLIHKKKKNIEKLKGKFNPKNSNCQHGGVLEKVIEQKLGDIRNELRETDRAEEIARKMVEYAESFIEDEPTDVESDMLKSRSFTRSFGAFNIRNVDDISTMSGY